MAREDELIVIKAGTDAFDLLTGSSQKSRKLRSTLRRSIDHNLTAFIVNDAAYATQLQAALNDERVEVITDVNSIDVSNGYFVKHTPILTPGNTNQHGLPVDANAVLLADYLQQRKRRTTGAPLFK